MRSCQKGDKKAQELLFEIYSDRMYRLSFRYVRSQPDAEDVMITSFSKIFRQISKFSYSGEGSLEGWIRKIVVNESLMLLRQRHNFMMSENIDLNFPEPDLSLLTSLEAEDILGMVSRLPTGYRTVFNLFVIDGFNHREIAAMLEITENTSRSQLYKAKSLLQKMLTREGFQYGT